MCYTHIINENRIGNEHQGGNIGGVWRSRQTAKRQAEIETQEQELKQLRKQVEEFPAQLEKTLKQAVDSARAEEQAKAKVAKDLMEKQVEGEKAVAKLKIETLEKTAKDQAEEIRMLKSQLERATAQIKDIAVSVIDSKRPIQAQSSNWTSGVIRLSPVQNLI